MKQLKSAMNDQTQHYANLSDYTRNGYEARHMLGAFWQIDEEIYDYFLSVLPPIYCQGGFRLSERLTDDIAATYLRIGADYWCAYTDLHMTKPAKMVSHISRMLSDRHD